jgi:ribosomal protein L32E
MRKLFLKSRALLQSTPASNHRKVDFQRCAPILYADTRGFPRLAQSHLGNAGICHRSFGASRKRLFPTHSPLRRSHGQTNTRRPGLFASLVRQDSKTKNRSCKIDPRYAASVRRVCPSRMEVIVRNPLSTVWAMRKVQHAPRCAESATEKRRSTIWKALENTLIAPNIHFPCSLPGFKTPLRQRL